MAHGANVLGDSEKAMYVLGLLWLWSAYLVMLGIPVLTFGHFEDGSSSVHDFFIPSRFGE